MDSPAHPVFNLEKVRRLSKYIPFLGLALILSFVIVHDTSAALVNRKISGLLPEFGDAGKYELSPDGHYVVFYADRELDGVDDLYSVATTSETPIRLNQPALNSGETIYGFEIASDSQHVVYWLGQEGDMHPEVLYSVPIGGGTPLVLYQSEFAPNTHFHYIDDVQMIPNGQGVVFTIEYQEGEDEVTKVLLTVPLSGGVPTQLFECSVCDLDFQITPNSLGVVYRCASYGPSTIEAIPISGGEPVLLSDPPEPAYDFKITPNSLGVVFTAATTDPSTLELYANYIGGGTPVKLSDPLLLGGAIEDFQITPNSQGVVYLTDEVVGEQFELYAAPITGGTRWKLNGALPSGGDVREFQITPNSLGVVYLADQEVNERQELYAVAIDGSTRYKLNDDLPYEGDVQEFQITPNSLGVVYLANQEDSGKQELYATWITGGEKIKLNAPLPSGGRVQDFEIT
ncbi:MAG: hypothetical protein P8Y03_05945, partial [Anaerolineales bacterium]